MSVRIYQLSKQIGMDNNELIDLLTKRGFQIKSASSTVDNISADSIIEEFGNTTPETKAEESDAGATEKAPVAEAPKPPSPASFVRTKEDVRTPKRKPKLQSKLP